VVFVADDRHGAATVREQEDGDGRHRAGPVTPGDRDVAGSPTRRAAPDSPAWGVVAAVAVILLGVFQIVDALGSLLEPGLLVLGLRGGIALLVRSSGQLHLGFGVFLLAAGTFALVACALRWTGTG
jgi:hypothetical protein